MIAADLLELRMLTAALDVLSDEYRALIAAVSETGHTPETDSHAHLLSMCRDQLAARAKRLLAPNPPVPD